MIREEIEIEITEEQFKILKEKANIKTEIMKNRYTIPLRN
jgi:hypothetical protein